MIPALAAVHPIRAILTGIVNSSSFPLRKISAKIPRTVSTTKGMILQTRKAFMATEMDLSLRVIIVMMTWEVVGPGRLQHRLQTQLNWVQLSHFLSSTMKSWVFLVWAVWSPLLRQESWNMLGMIYQLPLLQSATADNLGLLSSTDMILISNLSNTLNLTVNIHNTMGNTPQQTLTADIFSSFQELKKDHVGTQLKHKDTQLTYLLKQYTYSSDIEYERHRNRLEKDSEQDGCQFVLAVYRVRSHTVQGLCSTTHKIYAIYEYPQVTLLDQICARSQDHKLFDENQLWSILQSCSTAHKYLRNSVCITPKLVFITQDGQLKVVHGDIFDQNYRFCYDSSFNYAPEKMNNFNKFDTEEGLIKQGVFGVGMAVLMAALLTTEAQCYDHQNRKFLESNLQLMVEGIQGNYSAELVDLLASMVSVDPDRRPTFEELDKILLKYWQNSEVQGQEGNSCPPIHSERKRLMQSEQKGIIRNLATVSSQQKQSIRIQPSLPQPSKGIPLARMSESIQCQEEPNQFARLSLNQKPTNNKENIYTDPKLLQMIRKDLQDINRLKQSTLKETIKYSFLYPEGQSIFQSLQGVKIANKQPSKKNSPLRRPLEELERQNEDEVAEEFQQRKELEGRKMCEFVDEEGHRYQGEVFNGLKEGKGRLIFEDGAYYQGEFKAGQINGKGVLYYCQNKPAYDGMWVEGQFHGQGTLYNENPQTLSHPFDCKDFDEVEDYWMAYSGDFVEDSKCGKGRLELTNGQAIQGQFDSDLINGQCTFFGLEGEVRGVWQLNRLVHVFHSQ